jgi:predicted ATP-dependent endonuclease of OLD family
MQEPVYVDLHIHTSEDENNLNDNYDVNTLVDRIKKQSQNSNFLISLTDHNTINTDAYLKLRDQIEHIIIGVELHIRNSDSKPPYHCHFYFNIPITREELDRLNQILNNLYPNKKVSPPYDEIKKIDEIIQAFDDYDFLILPHGGQSHSAFHKSIDGRLDTKLTKGIYYNYFDGFTARNKSGLEKTVEYFKKLGIDDYINLITCTDNYNPYNYPNPKSAGEASPFLPTWMFAEPTFDGLRISLSESSRLVYSDTKPSKWAEYIRTVKIDNNYINIDVNLSSGLNVIIGDSSSGKTLFVDSIYNKLMNDFEKSSYKGLEIEDINIVNPANNIPHYIDQNYITKLISYKNNQIEDIDIIKKAFPDDSETKQRLDNELNVLKVDIDNLIKYVENIEKAEKEIRTIPALGSLIKKSNVKTNIIKNILPNDELIEKMDYTETSYQTHIKNLEDIESFIQENVFIKYDENDFKTAKEKLKKAHIASIKETKTRTIIDNTKKNIDLIFKKTNEESETKQANFERLISNIKLYKKSLDGFRQLVTKIKSYSFTETSREIESQGHKLSIEYIFKLDKDIFLEKINELLKSDKKIRLFEDIEPKKLYKDNFKDRPRIDTYDEFSRKLYTSFLKSNKKKYKIISNDGRDFDNLSAGWKTSVLLDLILGYDGDNSPLIIDQPEDNLANSYINNGLIKAIKNAKKEKQIIIVTHNATIPMLADAQNIIICNNDNEKITIKSAPLEGELYGKKVVDHIATLTDGGKNAIRKRFKKYNMKNFEE